MINLTEADKFYIQNNKDKTAKQLSQAIEKHEDAIKAYLLSLNNVEHTAKKKKGHSPLYKKLAKGRGAVALNSEFTMASEEIEKMNPPPTNPAAGVNRHRGVHGEDITTIRDDNTEE